MGLALLIGVVGGFVLAAAAAARRVDSTYDRLRGDIGPPNLILAPSCAPASGSGCERPADGTTTEQLVRHVAALDVIDRARQVETVFPYFVDAEGQPLFADDDDPTGCTDDDRSVHIVALTPGAADEQPLPFRLDGRLPAPGSSEIVISHATGVRERLAVGDAMHLAGWCTGAGDMTSLDRPIDLAITGVAIGPLDIEPPGEGITIEPAYIDRSIVERLLALGADVDVSVAMWTDAAADSEAVFDALAGYTILFDLDDRAAGFDAALAVDARQLWLLAGVGAVSGMLLLLGPLIAANLRATNRDRDTLVALGTSRDQLMAQGVAHVIVLAVIGALIAATVASPLSASMPRGFSTAIAPDRELWFDPVVICAGVVAVVLAVVTIGMIPAWRLSSGRRAERSDDRVRVFGSPHLRPSLHTGVLAAVGIPAGQRHANPWPSLLSLMVAGVTCVASVTYLAGLDRLHREPSFVGWNWDAIVYFDSEFAGEVPRYLDELARTPGIEQVTAGTTYPPASMFEPETGTRMSTWSFDTGTDAITPTMVSGRAPLAPNEIVVDDLFARQTGLSIGDSMSVARQSVTSQLAGALSEARDALGLADVQLDPPDDQPVVVTGFEITGRAVLPYQRTDEMGQVAFTLDGLGEVLSPSDEEIAAARAWLPADLPRELQLLTERFLAGGDHGLSTSGAFVRVDGDQRVAADVIPSVEHFAEVVAPTNEQVETLVAGLNLSRTDSVPKALATVVSVAAGLLLIGLLIVSVRSRLREIAILRTLGLLRAGVRWSLAAHATVTAIVPLLVAIPLGVAAGGWAWSKYARDLSVVATPVTPWSAIALVAIAAIVTANVVALAIAPSLNKRSLAAELRAG